MWIVFYVEGCGASSAEYCVHLVSVYIVVVHSWQNGTRCRDGVNVLWCRFHLVWLVFEGSILTCTCFHSEHFFVACTLSFTGALAIHFWKHAHLPSMFCVILDIYT